MLTVKVDSTIKDLLINDMNRTSSEAKVVYLLQTIWHGEHNKVIEHASREDAKRYYDDYFVLNMEILRDDEKWNQFSLQEKANHILDCAKGLGCIKTVGFENITLLVKENLPQAFGDFNTYSRGEIKEVIRIGDGVFFKTRSREDGIKYYIYDENIVFNELEHAICYFLSPTYYGAIMTLVNSDEKSPLFNKFDKE
jgi:hypothetical protein